MEIRDDQRPLAESVCVGEPCEITESSCDPSLPWQPALGALPETPSTPGQPIPITYHHLWEEIPAAVQPKPALVQLNVEEGLEGQRRRQSFQ